MIGAKTGIYAIQGGESFVGVLDGYAGIQKATGYWQFLSGYSGALVEIRRDSDNATKDFFPDSNNELSMSSEDGSGTTLSSWIGSDNGFVRTRYDQSGNGHDDEQPTASAQEQIIVSGTLQTKNGKAKSLLNGTTRYSRFIQFTGTNTQILIADRLRQNGSFQRPVFFSESNINTNFAKGGLTIFPSGASYLAHSIDGVSFIAITSTAFPAQHCILFQVPQGDGTNPDLYQNGTLAAQTDDSTPRPSPGGTYGFIGALGRGNDSSIGQYADIDFQAHICFSTDQTSNRTTIESEITTYYGL